MVFCENTRFRFKNYDRARYVEPMQKLTENYLRRSIPLEFVNSLDIAAGRKSLARFKLLVLPQTSGMDDAAIAALYRYVEQGGSLLVAGDALRHDASGHEQPDFAMAAPMGVNFRQVADAPDGATLSGRLPGDSPLPACKFRSLAAVEPRRGDTPLWLKHQEKSWPLLQVNRLGAGSVAYLASMDSVELVQTVMDSLAGPPPVVVTPCESCQAVLTTQPDKRQWVLHLISDGDYSVELNRRHVPATRIVDRYPKEGWQCQNERIATGLSLMIRGPARDRLLVLKQPPA